MSEWPAACGAKQRQSRPSCRMRSVADQGLKGCNIRPRKYKRPNADPTSALGFHRILVSPETRCDRCHPRAGSARLTRRTTLRRCEGSSTKSRTHTCLRTSRQLRRPSRKIHRQVVYTLKQTYGVSYARARSSCSRDGKGMLFRWPRPWRVRYRLSPLESAAVNALMHSAKSFPP